MFCPKCLAEYRDGFTQCSDCQVLLVQELPPKISPQPHMNLVTVLETIDINLLMVSKSFLDAAKINYVVEGESIMDPLSTIALYGRKKPTRLQVAKENARINEVEINFLQQDILQTKILPKVDLMVSNPPYVLESEKEKMQQNVLEIEHVTLGRTDVFYYF